MKITPPGQDEPLVDSSGRITPVWYEKLKQLFDRGLTELPDVDKTGLTTGDVLIWDNTAKRWEPGAN